MTGLGNFTSKDFDRLSALFLRGFVVSANLRNTFWLLYMGKMTVSATPRKTFTRNAQKNVRFLARKIALARPFSLRNPHCFFYNSGSVLISGVAIQGSHTANTVAALSA